MKGVSVLKGKYAVTMDMYPLQSKDFNRIHKFQNLWRNLDPCFGPY
jgi:hypothetical protein